MVMVMVSEYDVEGMNVQPWKSLNSPLGDPSRGCPRAQHSPGGLEAIVNWINRSKHCKAVVKVYMGACTWGIWGIETAVK